MNARWILVAGALLAMGCEAEMGPSGHVMTDFFPFDGERTWTFGVNDESDQHHLLATLDSDYESANDGHTRIYTLDYELVCPSALGDCEPDTPSISQARWSNDSTYGALLHGFIHQGEEVALHPPVQLARSRMLVGDRLESEVDGHTWEATLEAFEPCPLLWPGVEWECARFELDDGGAGSPVAGTYWAVPSYGFVAMDRSADAELWQLIVATHE